MLVYRHGWTASAMLLIGSLSFSVVASSLPAKQNSESLWDDLASPDAEKAFQAMCALRKDPTKAISLLNDRMHTEGSAEARRLESLLGQLGSPQFTARQRASDELQRLGDLAVSFLERSLERDALPLEMRRRVELILKAADGPVTDTLLLRKLRAVELLEQLGGQQSEAVLARLAAGVEYHRVTRMATSALRSLRLRSSPLLPQGKDGPNVDGYGDPLPAGAFARLGTLRFRHSQPAFFVGFAEGGKTLVTASEDQFVRFWDAKNGKPLGKLKIPKTVNWPPGQNALQLSLGGDRLAVLAADRRVIVWSVPKAEVVIRLSPPPAPKAIALSPDGKLLAMAAVDASEKGVIRLVDVDTGQEVRRWDEAKPEHYRLRFSSDGKLLLTVQWAEPVRLREVATGKQLASLARGKLPFEDVALSPGGTLLASVEPQNGTVRLTDVRTNKDRLLEDPNVPLLSRVHFSADGRTLVAVPPSLGDIILWDVTTGWIVQFIPGRGDRSVAFHPNSKQLAVAGEDNSIQLWQVNGGLRPLRMAEQGHDMPPVALTFSADERLVASLSWDRSARVWDRQSSRQIERYNMPRSDPNERGFVYPTSFDALVFSKQHKRLDSNYGIWDRGSDNLARPPELEEDTTYWTFLPASDPRSTGKALASFCRHGSVRLWDLDAEKVLHRQTWFLDEREQRDLNVGISLALGGSPNGMALAAWGGRELQAFGKPEPTELRIWEMPSGKVRFRGRPDAKVGEGIAGRVRRQRGTRHLMDLSNKDVPKNMHEYSAVVFSPAGDTLALVSGYHISLWDPATNRTRLHIEDKKVLAETCVFSPDGRLLAALTEDGKLRLWDAADGKMRGEVANPDAKMACFAFSSDGRTLATGHWDTTILLWDVATLTVAHGK
jgi:WD40 repeat protein